MTDELERKLRDALAPTEPPEGFAARVLARVDAEAARGPVVVPWRERIARPQVRWFAGAALAASIALAVGIGYSIDARHDREGLEARRQLIEALRVTSEKLDVAYQAVNKDGSKAGV